MAVTFSDDQPQGVITTVKMSTTNFTAAINSPLLDARPVLAQVIGKSNAVSAFL
jgi:hypothetical protein